MVGSQCLQAMGGDARVNACTQQGGKAEAWAFMRMSQLGGRVKAASRSACLTAALNAGSYRPSNGGDRRLVQAPYGLL